MKFPETPAHLIYFFPYEVNFSLLNTMTVQVIDKPTPLMLMLIL
jgi:hypothetical protein